MVILFDLGQTSRRVVFIFAMKYFCVYSDFYLDCSPTAFSLFFRLILYACILHTYTHTVYLCLFTWSILMRDALCLIGNHVLNVNVLFVDDDVTCNGLYLAAFSLELMCNVLYLTYASFTVY